MIKIIKASILISYLIVCATAYAVADLPMTLDIEMSSGHNIPIQNGRPMISFDPQDKPILDLGGNWKKRRLEMDNNLSLSQRNAAWFASIAIESGGATEPEYNDSSWPDHILPGVENIMPATPEDPIGAEVYNGGIYYRRHFNVPNGWDNKVIRLICLAADYVSDVWINGTWVGYHEGGYTPTAFDVTDVLNFTGDNVIVFRIDSVPWRLRADTIPYLFSTDWQHYVGIIQDVYLQAYPKIHIVRADVIPKSITGELDVTTVIENRSDMTANLSSKIEVFSLNPNHPDYLTDPVASHLIDKPMTLEGESEKSVSVTSGKYACVPFYVSISDPNLWTPSDPSLYLLKVTLFDGSTEIDSFATQFGIRTVEVESSAKVLLNRKPVFFTGMARHEDWPDHGRTATWDKILYDLQLMRDTDVWFIRTAHYPNHPYTYLLTDRIGFAVWSEIPAWWINAISVEVLMNRGLAKQMWREMIFNGRNRPSILFWSLCNEPMWYFVFNLRDYVKDLHSDLDGNFPDGRLVTQSLAADGAILTADAQEDVDVAGWTMYFGVFYGNDITSESAQFLKSQHERFPNKPILVCEYGYWSGSDGSEEGQQIDIANQSLDAFYQFAAVDMDGNNTDGFVSAVTWWCQFNYYRVQAPHIQTMGIMHMDRITLKPIRDNLKERYRPYFEMGGLGEFIQGNDDDLGDDDSSDDDTSQNNKLSNISSELTSDNQGCGC